MITTQLWLFAILLTTGASRIGEFLKNNSTLTILSMVGNSISNDGILQLMKGLLQNSTLTKLYMTDCGLSAKGAIIIVTLVEVLCLTSTHFWEVQFLF